MKRVLKILILLYVIIPLTAVAMPPHPKLVEEYKKQGELSKLATRLKSINIKMNKNSPEKLFPASGDFKIPVLLVRYNTPYTESSAKPLLFGNNYSPDKKFNLPIIVITFIFSVLMFSVAVKKHRNIPAFLIAYISFFSFPFSCSSESNTSYIDTTGFSSGTIFYNNLFNGETSSDLSLRKYYQEMSNSKMNITFDVFGPVQIPKSWDYYGANNSSGDDMHPGELVSAAVQKMVTLYSSTDFSHYDNDNDGKVDTIIIIHQGRGEESGADEKTIWSHKWDLVSAKYYGDGSGPVTADGVTFNVYTIQPEYTFSEGDSSIGVFAHELGHVFGLPDLYDINGDTYGVGNWSLMASGSWCGPGYDGTRPAPLLAWERNIVGNGEWIAITSITGSGTYSINDIESGHTVYKINLDSGTGQYLLLEGKKQSTADQWTVNGTGILVTHIHEGIITAYMDENTINTGSGRVHGVNIVEADNGNNLWNKTNYGTGTDLYYSGNNASLTETTTPDTKYYTSTSPIVKDGSSGVSITGIGSASFPMTLDVDLP
jgi:M6 family metalloprotease-like protein